MRMIKRIFSIEFLLMPFYLYKLIEIFVFKNQNNFAAITTRLLLTLLALPLTFVTVIAFAIHYHVVEVILRIKCGKQFDSMLDGCDRMWVLKFPSRNIINAVYTIAPGDDEDVAKSLLDLIKGKYKIIASTHPRFSSVIKHYMGLQYYKIVDLDFDVCVKYMDEYNNEAELFKLLEKYSNQALPMNDEYLWEFYIGKKEFQWYGKTVYPVLVRYHHSLGDGISLISLMTAHLLEDGVNLMRRKCQKYKELLEKTPQKSNTADFLSKRFYYPTISDPERPNLLHSGELSGDKHMIFVRETDGDDLIHKIKGVKNHYGIAFVDVVSAAISASLHQYFARHEKTPPKNVISMIPYFLVSPDFNKLLTFKNGIPIANLGNKFSMGFTKVPINLNTSSNNNQSDQIGSHNDLYKRLMNMHDINLQLKNSLDFFFCYWQMRMFTGIPLSIGKKLLILNDASICISNVPGNTTTKLLNGCEVTDTFVFANNYGNLGVTITIFTYDERFRIGLLIDKSLIKEHKEAQELGDNIFKFVNIMWQHIHEGNKRKIA